MTICATCGRPHEGAIEPMTVASSSVVSTRALPVWILPAVVLVGLAVALLWFLGRDGDDSLQAESTTTVPAVVDLDDPVTTEESLSEVSNVAVPDGLDFTVAYESSRGVVLLDLADGEATVVELPITPTGVIDRFLLGTEGGQTWAVDRGDPTSTVLFSNHDNVVPVGARDVAVLYEDSEGVSLASLVATNSGAASVPVSLPVGATVVAAPGDGVFVVPATGGTLELLDVDGVATLAPFSDGRVLSASGDHHVELRCDDSLECTTLLVGPNGPGREIDVDRDVAIKIAPDGSALALVAEDELRLREVTETTGAIDGTGDAIFEIVDPKVSEMVWAPDGSFLAWLSPGDQSLTVLDRGSDTWSRINLGDLAPPLDESTLLVFN